MSTKISILLPTIGAREAEINRLFGSLIDQAYAELEVIVVIQDNYEVIKKLCDLYTSKLDIFYICTDQKGLSRARNLGIRSATGDIVLLSDDDCWYEKDAIRRISKFFENNPEVDILLTQIYDPISGVLYKNYPTDQSRIKKNIALLSKSSIEIAFRRKGQELKFDELFGLGAKYIAGEDNDFLICALKNKKVIQYEPVITVYHEKKKCKESKNQLIAKGAFYSKNFGFLVSNLVLLYDLLIKHQNNYRWFWNGYFDYKKQN